jgi:hypothetical protein
VPSPSLSSGKCEDLKTYKCLMNRKNEKLIKEISEHRALQHYLEEFENILEKDFLEFHQNLKKHHGH